MITIQSLPSTASQHSPSNGSAIDELDSRAFSEVLGRLEHARVRAKPSGSAETKADEKTELHDEALRAQCAAEDNLDTIHEERSTERGKVSTDGAGVEQDIFIEVTPLELGGIEESRSSTRNETLVLVDHAPSEPTLKIDPAYAKDGKAKKLHGSTAETMNANGISGLKDKNHQASDPDAADKNEQVSRDRTLEKVPQLDFRNTYGKNYEWKIFSDAGASDQTRVLPANINLNKKAGVTNSEGIISDWPNATVEAPVDKKVYHEIQKELSGGSPSDIRSASASEDVRYYAELKNKSADQSRQNLEFPKLSTSYSNEVEISVYEGKLSHNEPQKSAALGVTKQLSTTTLPEVSAGQTSGSLSESLFDLLNNVDDKEISSKVIGEIPASTYTGAASTAPDLSAPRAPSILGAVPSYPLDPTFIAQKIPRRPGLVEISLSPVELGSLSIIVSHNDNGLAVTLSADRDETANLLRRHADELKESLGSLGYTDVNINFGGGERESGWAERAGKALEEEAHVLDLMPTSSGVQPRMAPGRMDIKL